MVFAIDYGGNDEVRLAEADKLSLDKKGNARLYLNGVMVGYAKDGYWRRIYIDAKASQPARLSKAS